MAGQWGRASRWRCHPGYFSGAPGRVNGNHADGRETPGRIAVSGAPPPSFPGRFLPGRAEHITIAASQRGDAAVSTDAAISPLRRTRPPERAYNRSWRATAAALRVVGAASVLSLAHWAAWPGDQPRGAKLLDAASPRARRLCLFLGGIFPVGRSAGASRRPSGATLPCRQTRLTPRSAALDLPSERATDHGGPMTSRIALAAPPRLFLWRTGPRERDTGR